MSRPGTPSRSDAAAAPTVACHPVTSERVGDLERFASVRGRHRHRRLRSCGYLRGRLPTSAFQRSTPDRRRRALVDLVRAAVPVGVLAYADGEPVGWCSVAPRPTQGAVARSRQLAPVDAAPVWSVVCVVVDARFRRRLTGQLPVARVAYATDLGATVVDGYPVEPDPLRYPYVGSPATVRTAGFRDVMPPGRSRRVVRRGAVPAEGASDPGLYSGRPSPGTEEL